MRNHIYSLIDLAVVLFCIRSSSAIFFTCDQTIKNFFDRKFTSCESTVASSDVLLPGNITKEVEYLYIEAKNNSTLAINELNVFTNSPSLLGLDIRVDRTLQISDTLNDWDTKEKLKNELFALPHLKILIIKFSQFNPKKFNFVLPSSLEEFTLINSSISLDLNLGGNLRKLNLSRSELSKMPTNQKLPYLMSLDLSFNPLNEFTVFDIAGFCHLDFLRIENSSISECECLKLQKFVSLLIRNIRTFQFVGKLPCSNDTKSTKCSIDVDEAMNMRRKCIVTLMRPYAFDLADVGIITLLLVAFCGGCCVFLSKTLLKIEL